MIHILDDKVTKPKNVCFEIEIKMNLNKKYEVAIKTKLECPSQIKWSIHNG